MELSQFPVKHVDMTLGDLRDDLIKQKETSPTTTLPIYLAHRLVRDSLPKRRVLRPKLTTAWPALWVMVVFEISYENRTLIINVVGREDSADLPSSRYRISRS